MNFSSHDAARRCRLDSFLSVRASTVISPTAFFRHLFNRCLIGSISRHAFNLCLANAFLPVHATHCLLNCCQAAFASSKVVVVVPMLPVIRCQPPLPFSRCQPSVVLHPLSGSGVEGLFALCVAFSTDEWTRSGNESVELEMDLVESRFVESRWK